VKTGFSGDYMNLRQYHAMKTYPVLN